MTTIPAELVPVPAGEYVLGEPGEERSVVLAGVLIARYPVTNEQALAWVEATDRAVPADVTARLRAPALAAHPVTGLTLADARAYCEWASELEGRRLRLPTGAEWEAAARGHEARRWPWGDVFAEDRCACVESGWGWTAPVDAHPAGASEAGVEQLAGNVWEWVDEEAGEWVCVRGGSYLDCAWGLRASRALPADPARATATTGFRVAADPNGGPR